MSACGGGAEAFGVGSGEGGIAAEAGAEAAFRGAEAPGDEIPGMEQAAVGQIAVDGLARFLAEQAHHVVLADEKFLGKAVNGDVLRQMGVDVPEHFHHPGILGTVRTGAQGGPAVETAADPGQKLEQKAVGQHHPAKFIGG